MYQVGLARGLIDDKTRNNWTGDGPRPVAWVAWYPVDDTVHGEKLCVNSSTKNATFVIFGGFLNVEINRSRNTWPVVLLSHGTGGSAFGMDWLGARLAALGFIAISVNHHGNTAMESYLPEGFLCWWERADDLKLALDRLAIEGVLAGAIDFSRVFAAGFSLGAYTVLALAGAITDVELFQQWLETTATKDPHGPKEFPNLSEHIPKLLASSAEFTKSQARQHENYCDSRIKAVLALAPPPPIRAFSHQSLGAIDIPVHIVVGQADKEAPADTCASWLKTHLPNIHLTLLGKNVGHYVFLGEPTELGKTTEPDTCIDAQGVERSTIHHQTTQIAFKLFESAAQPVVKP